MAPRSLCTKHPMSPRGDPSSLRTPTPCGVREAGADSNQRCPLGPGWGPMPEEQPRARLGLAGPGRDRGPLSPGLSTQRPQDAVLASTADRTPPAEPP